MQNNWIVLDQLFFEEWFEELFGQGKNKNNSRFFFNNLKHIITIKMAKLFSPFKVHELWLLALSISYQIWNEIPKLFLMTKKTMLNFTDIEYLMANKQNLCKTIDDLKLLEKNKIGVV